MKLWVEMKLLSVWSKLIDITVFGQKIIPRGLIKSIISPTNYKLLHFVSLKFG